VPFGVALFSKLHALDLSPAGGGAGYVDDILFFVMVDIGHVGIE
jgi:hypothetical protein